MPFSDFPHLRAGVGLILVNPLDKKVLVAKHHNRIGFQFPQGGIDMGESEESALFREAHEELGTKNFKILKKSSKLLWYYFPSNIQKKFFDGVFMGQVQRWFLCLFEGRDFDIQLGFSHSPEFHTWKWADFFWVKDQVVDFKKPLYEDIEKEFSPFFTP